MGRTFWDPSPEALQQQAAHFYPSASSNYKEQATEQVKIRQYRQRSSPGDESSTATKLSAEAPSFTTDCITNSEFNCAFQTSHASWCGYSGNLTPSHDQYISTQGNQHGDGSNPFDSTPMKVHTSRARTEQSNLVISPYSGQAIVLLEGAVNTENICP